MSSISICQRRHQSIDITIFYFNWIYKHFVQRWVQRNWFRLFLSCVLCLMPSNVTPLRAVWKNMTYVGETKLHMLIRAQLNMARLQATLIKTWEGCLADAGLIVSGCGRKTLPLQLKTSQRHCGQHGHLQFKFSRTNRYPGCLSVCCNWPSASPHTRQCRIINTRFWGFALL